MTSPQSTTTYLLIGDIGGTNSRLGLCTVDDCFEPLVVKWERNQELLTSGSSNPIEDGIFERNVIAPFLKTCWEEEKKDVLPPIQDVTIVACLAVAGPVSDNAAAMSNLQGIVIDGTAIVEQKYNTASDPYLARIKICTIINDFVALGYGCLTVQPDEMKEISPGSFARKDPSGPIVCVGAGTGLGECYLTPDAETNEYTCFPSEGGHVEFAPRNELEVELWKYLRGIFGSHVSVERVVSGRGLASVYEFLVSKFPKRVDGKVHKEFLAAGDMQGKVVSVNATEGSLCQQALKIMMSTYGSSVGSSALKFIPRGGLYVTGGLAPKNLDYIIGPNTPFWQACADKGRVSPILLDIVPIFVVLAEDLGVRGAYHCAKSEYNRFMKTPGTQKIWSEEDMKCDGEVTKIVCTDFQLSISKTTLKKVAVATIVATASVGMMMMLMRKKRA